MKDMAESAEQVGTIYLCNFGASQSNHFLGLSGDREICHYDSK